MYTRALITHPKTRPRIVMQPGQVRAIVMHWTANKDAGANAMANRNYFNNGSPDENGKPRPASAHFCVDSERVVQCLPTNEVGYHVGDPRKNKECAPLNAILRQGFKTPNFTTVGVEMCVNRDGNLMLMKGRACLLAARLLFEHGLEIRQLVRHWDITGKVCPAFYVPVGKDALLNTAGWIGFCRQAEAELDILKVTHTRARVTSPELNLRAEANATAPILGALIRGEPISYQKSRMRGTWAEVWPGHWVNTKFSEPF